MARIIPGRVVSRWRRFWVPRSGYRGFGRIAARFAAAGTPPYHGREFLSRLHPNGFVAHTASLTHPRIRLGRQVFIGDRVVAWAGPDAGDVELEDDVCLYGDSFVHTAHGASITIQAGTHVQPGCLLHACLADITIGRRVEMAPRCALYSYDHGIDPGAPIMSQPLHTKGPIAIGDDAWLGHAVVVLSGVRIGAGAVIGAGSVVSTSIPDNAIAVGNPARVVSYRGHPFESRHLRSASS